MQQQLINHSDDLQRLVQEGYDIEVSGGYLLVRRIPYVTVSSTVDLGTLVCILTLTGPNTIAPPADHTIYFRGQTPCDKDGNPLEAIINNSDRKQLTSEIDVDHYFSSKPINGNYPSYFEKIRTYAEVLSVQAKMIDSTVTVKPLKNSKTLQ